VVIVFRYLWIYCDILYSGLWFLTSGSTSLWQHHVQSAGAVLGLVWSGRKNSFRIKAMCYFQETHGVDMLLNYTSQGIAVHILIWDPWIRVLGSSMFDGVEF
jgi:hypothetical protein